tara:strand:+ start:1016 stop:1273 length:258 start_codon:yes stop_codon:yes gene_type:complete
MTYNTDTKILGKIAAAQSKIQRLESLRSLAPYEQCTFFFYGSSGKFLSINENDVPFDLAIEMRILIDASIEHYEDEIQSLSNSFL